MIEHVSVPPVPVRFIPASSRDFFLIRKDEPRITRFFSDQRSSRRAGVHEGADTQPPSPPVAVLVVEDHPELRLSVAEFLELEGYLVSVADDYDTAMQVLREGFRPDLILCDVVLPGPNGADFIRDSRALAPHSKVLFMSACPPGRLPAGVDRKNLLEKPFRLDTLACRIRKALANEASQ